MLLAKLRREVPCHGTSPKTTVFIFQGSEYPVVRFQICETFQFTKAFGKVSLLDSPNYYVVLWKLVFLWVIGSSFRVRLSIYPASTSNLGFDYQGDVCHQCGKLYFSIWVFPKIMGKPPNHSFAHRVFHDFHHPFWGKYHPYFWVDTHINFPDVDPGYFTWLNLGARRGFWWTKWVVNNPFIFYWRDPVVDLHDFHWFSSV